MYAIFINGGYGVGKSSALEHIGDVLAQNEIPFSLMDVDWFHRSWPTATDDPKNVKIEAMNMAAVWKNYQAAGPRQLVVSGVIYSQSDLERYEKALGLSVRSVLLDTSSKVQEARLRRRYSAERSAALEWHIDRFASVAEDLRHSDCNELTISTDALTPFQVAGAILQHFELLSTSKV